MQIIGQSRIQNELSAIGEKLKQDSSLSINILLKGEAGSGKTLLATNFLSKYIGEYTKQIPADFKNKFVFPERAYNFRGHFIDECHDIKNLESCYPIMDLDRFILVFASNEYGAMPDAFTSRCFEYNLDPYTQSEIEKIILEYAKVLRFKIEKSSAIKIAERSRLSPRIAKQYLNRVSFIINSKYRQNNEKGIITALNDIGVYDGGYTVLDIRYMQTLQKLQLSSLVNLCRILRIDKETVVNKIEPFLIDRGHIVITGRGRKFVKW